MSIRKEDARIRNLKMKIAHWIIEEQGNLNIKFTDKVLEDDLFFKKEDLKIGKVLFEETGHIKVKVKEEIEDYVSKYKVNKDVDEQALPILYNNLKSYFTHNTNKEDYNQNLKKTIELIKKLHWKYLPIYKEQYICNNGYIPEDTECYYNHFHAIEDLYWHIFTDKNISWKSKDGDINLEIDFELKIYTNRWGHYDYYDMKRTVDGWYIKGLPAGTGECEKDGKGAFTNLLEHDFVCYPKDGVLYALEELWKEADTTDMTVEALQEKIRDLSEWIKQVEIVTHKYQPDWCRYY